MTTELTVLAWACLLAILHLWLPIRAKTRQYGLRWNMGPRDVAPEPAGAPSPVAGRLERAQANYYESFPLIAAAILIAGLFSTSGDLLYPYALLLALTAQAA